MIWLNPYFWSACILGIALSVFGGCRWQASNDADKIQNAELQRDLYKIDVSTLSQSLHEINAKADQAKRDAEDQRRNAVIAIKQADKDRAAYDKRVAALGKELADAMKVDSCRIEMEKPLCAPLH